jgi:hypothetical protein
MAVLVIAEAPGGTAEQDEAMMRQLGLGDSPAPGALVRVAGPVEGGWRIVSVWESQEAVEAFRRERLEPALRQAGEAMPQIEVSPLHSVRLAPQRG